MTLEQTKAYFDSFICEVLTSSPHTEEELQDFSCKIRQNTLEGYFKTKAWKDDLYGENRIYVIRETENKRIVFFFSLKCGILFTTYELDDDYRALPDGEKIYVNMLIDARRGHGDEGFYALLDTGKAVFPESIARLQNIAEHRLNKKNELNEVNDVRSVMKVHECYSAIEIQHLCRSDTFKMNDDVAYPLGFGLFWQKIIPIILKVAQQIGCEYLYLFAADRSDNPDDKKLVSYYKDALRFREVDDEGVIVLKPGYDDNCIGLLQSVSNLTQASNYAWESFSDHVRNSGTLYVPD